MMDEPRRLKRGLKDVSPLFEASPPEKRFEFKPALRRLQSLSLFSPEALGESLFLNGIMASRMKAAGQECILISVGSEYSPGKNAKKKNNDENAAVKRLRLSASRFDEICRSYEYAESGLENSIFFFDFDYSNPLHFEKVIPILDQWILLIKPVSESLVEGYKFIKASIPLNQNLEYHMIYNGPAAGNQSSQLFENFSELISRRLGVTLHWLGHFDPRFAAQTQGIALDSLQAGACTDSMEKRALAGMIYPDSREFK